MNQKGWAKEEMLNFLYREEELGKKPKKIVCTKMFVYNDLNYYIFKFKKGMFDKYWLIGVVGGYEDGAMEHCGHVFTEYEDYDQEMEEVYAKRMIEIVKDLHKKI